MVRHIIGRLRDEYRVDAIYEPMAYKTARWVTAADPDELRAFERRYRSQMALDSCDKPAFFCTDVWDLQYIMKQYPKIRFHTTSEIS